MQQINLKPHFISIAEIHKPSEASAQLGSKYLS